MELRSTDAPYACWNKGYSLNYPVNRTNFVGFVSGNFLKGWLR